MLVLSDPAWGLLRGPYGSSEFVPEMLKKLQAGYDVEIADTLYWEELFHQNTIYISTYAAVPYLVDIAVHTSDPKAKADIYTLCGISEANNPNIAGTKTPLEFSRERVVMEQGKIEDIYQSYIRAISVLASLTEEIFTYIETTKCNVGKRYVLAAAAALHGYRAMANMLLTYDTGEEYMLNCPECGSSLYLWPDEGGQQLVAHQEDPVVSDRNHYEFIEPMKREAAQEVEVIWLYRHASQVGEHTLLAQMPYITGRFTCPVCSGPVSVWHELLKS